jgi:hypothetical protein
MDTPPGISTAIPAGSDSQVANDFREIAVHASRRAAHTADFLVRLGQLAVHAGDLLVWVLGKNLGSCS